MTLVVNVPVDPVNFGEAGIRVEEWISDRRRPPAVVVHTNAFSVVTAHEDSVYREALGRADLSLPDGMPLVWLLRWAGYDQKDRVYGPDLMLMLCEQAEQKGWRCFLYGGGDDVAESVRQRLLSMYPSLQIVGCHCPPFRDLTAQEDDEVVRKINDARADILWVALGGPKQDLWMVNHRERLNLSVLHGVGAAFDILAGRVPQAPAWMRSHGLEWLFRLFVEPRRLWRRYTVKNVKFLYLVLTREIGRRLFLRSSTTTTK